MYNNYGSIQIYDFYPLKDDAWNLLKEYRSLPKEIWQSIWNYLIDPKLIYFNMVNEKCYFNVLKLGLTSRSLYHLFQNIRLKILYLKFSKLTNTDISFSKLYNYTRLLEECKYPIRKTRDIKTLDEIKQYKNISDSIIMTYKNRIQTSLLSYERTFTSKNCRIDEGDFIYLCNIYEYKYERCIIKRCRVLTCTSCYILSLTACCPLITLCCPCLCYWQIKSCENDSEDSDPYIQSGPIPCFPWTMINTNITYKKWCERYSLC
jgi:hypothetical protein